MAQYQTADGRWLVGDVNGENDYHGFLGWRDCVIRLTDSGATTESVNYLNAFRDYAFAHNALGEPIMPPSVNVWISNKGVTSAVQADDVSVSGNTFTIGGIKWDGSAWDYTNAGQSSGGGSGLVVAHATVNPDQMVPGENIEITLDKTFEELKAAGVNSAIEIGILFDETATAPVQIFYLYPYSWADGIIYSLRGSEEASLSVTVIDDEAVLMFEQRDTVETVLVTPTLGEAVEGVYPVTAINKSYDQITTADICFAKFFAGGLTYTLPRAAHGYQEGVNRVLFESAEVAMTLAFNNNVLDPKNSTVAIG